MEPTLTRFQEIYKSRALRFGPSSQAQAVSQRVNNLHQQRRISRNTVMMSKRKINEGTLTPIASPATIEKKKKRTQVVVQEEKKDHRLEMLKKWQEQKRKQLDKQKANKKPLFKVHHVAVSSQYNLEPVYGNIKGKPIATSTKAKTVGQEQPRLAPSSTYKFKPPANIKPIKLGTGFSNKLPKLKSELAPTARVTRSQKPLVSPPLLQLPVRTRQRLNFQTVEANKSTPKKKPLKSSNKTAVKQQYPEPVPSTSTASAEEQQPGRNKKKEKRSSRSVQSSKNSKTVPESTDDDDVFISEDVCVTPSNKCSGPSIYVSPFVTMSRGKDNARKEFHRRSVRGGTDGESSTSPKAAAAYFYQLLNNKTDRLRMLCHEWTTYKDKEKPEEEISDMIDVAVGQTELLLTKKFQQFKGLIVSCETGDSEKPVTCLDLHGFWDMVMIQVDNLDKRFENLQKLKENGWEEILPLPKPNQRIRPKRKVVKRSTTTSSSSLRSAIQEARKKKSAKDEPSTSPKTPEYKQTRSRRSSLRISTLNSEAKRKIGSPGLLMIAVTQAAKSAEKSIFDTPLDNNLRTSPKSILKSQSSKSVGRKSKVVLFKESRSSSEDKENEQNSSNMILFTPPACTTTRRRSKRLAKCQ